MLDRDDEYAVDGEKSPVQELKNVAFLLKGLYAQLNEEREAITLAAGQMNHAVKQFHHHLVQFEAFEKSCGRSIANGVKTELQQSIQNIASTIAGEVAIVAYKPIANGIESLNQLSNQISATFQVQMQEKRRSWRNFSLMMVLTAIIGGSVGGLVLHHFAAERSQITQLKAGRILMRAWDKLSKTEQEKIIKLGRLG
jgi:hypothetical protein